MRGRNSRREKKCTIDEAFADGRGLLEETNKVQELKDEDQFSRLIGSGAITG